MDGNPTAHFDTFWRGMNPYKENSSDQNVANVWSAKGMILLRSARETLYYDQVNRSKTRPWSSYSSGISRSDERIVDKIC